MATEPNIKELEFKIAELEKGYELARMGLRSGSTGVVLVFVGALLVLAAAIFSFVWTGRELISGWQLVAIIAILVVALVVYFAFIYRREAKLLAAWKEYRVEVLAGRSTETSDRPAVPGMPAR